MKYGEHMTSDHNLGPARETYSGFITMFKVGSVVAAMVAVLVVILIS